MSAEDWDGREAVYRGAEVSRGHSTASAVGPLDRDTRPKGEKRSGVARPATANRKARTEGRSVRGQTPDLVEQLTRKGATTVTTSG